MKPNESGSGNRDTQPCYFNFALMKAGANASTNVTLHHRIRAFSKLPVAGLLLFHCATASAQVVAGDVHVTNLLATRGEVEYEIRSGADCRIRWVVSRTGINAGIAQLRSDCRLTMSEQLPVQSKILARVAADEPGLRTLFWGGLAKWPEWSERLALAAARSPSWDPKAGRPKAGQGIDAFVLSLISQTDIFSEFEQVLADLHLRIKVSGVETVSVTRAGSLPFFSAYLAPAGVSASAKLPVNCLIWFSVERAERESESK